MHTLRPFVLALAVLIGSAGARAADTYAVDPAHSTVLFKIKHLNLSYVHGRINNPSGTLVVDADPANSSVELELKAENIDTFNEKRDQHLRNPDFFNAKQFPTITFKSTAVKKADETHLDVSGNLTLLGVTKPVTVKFEHVGEGKDPWGGFRTGYEGTFTIKRSDYGMTQMVGPVGDDVEVTVSIEASKK
jgi:polyisoprenoid-binding protein YceI